MGIGETPIHGRVATLDTLLGRGSELAAIERLVTDAVGRRGGALVVRGDPGIGKTALLERARELAGDRVRVIAARGVEGESRIPYAGLHTLLAGLLQLRDRLPARQRDGLAGALALGPRAGDRLTVAAATLGLLDAAAEEQPLLVLVDDAHWLDAASSEALVFAARRVEAEPVALLLAVREDEGEQFRTAGLPELTLAGLDADDAATLLERASGGPLPGEVVKRLLAASAGNPLALIELPRALTEEQLAGREPFAELLPPGGYLQAAFLRRAERLSPDARRLLLLAAASADDRVDTVERAAAQAGLTLDALAEAEAEGLIKLDVDELRFHTPLVRAAVYHGAAAADRRSAHRALAEGEPRVSVRAWQLAEAAAGRDDEAAAALELAACEALERGAQREAARAYEGAARLGPGGPVRARRLVWAAAQGVMAGSSERAVGLLDEAADNEPDLATLAMLKQLQSRLELLRGSVETAHEIGVEAASHLADEDPTQAAATLLEAALPCFMAGHVELGLTTTERAHELARGGPFEPATRVCLGTALIIAGRNPAEGAALLQCWRDVARPEVLLPSPSLLFYLAQGLTWTEEYEAAYEVCDMTIAAARGAGAAGPLQLALGQRADVAYRTGRWTESRGDANESIRVAEEAGQTLQATYPLAVLVRLEVALGLDEEAAANAERANSLAGVGGMGAIPAYTEAAECMRQLGRGDAAAAVVHGRRVRAIVSEFDMRDPSVLQWRPDLVEALVRSGARAEAETEVRALERQAEGLDRPWVRASLARCRGFLAPPRAIDPAFSEALSWHERGADPFERARTQLAYGERLRRARRAREAREPLRAALHTFTELEAEPWARRGQTELRASGGAVPASARRPTSRELTAQELEIATLVAGGATNREVAQSLYISPKTVEAHLSRAYRKLAVRSRTELAARMAGTRR